MNNIFFLSFFLIFFYFSLDTAFDKKEKKYQQFIVTLNNIRRIFDSKNFDRLSLLNTIDKEIKNYTEAVISTTTCSSQQEPSLSSVPLQGVYYLVSIRKNLEELIALIEDNLTDKMKIYLQNECKRGRLFDEFLETIYLHYSKKNSEKKNVSESTIPSKKIEAYENTIEALRKGIIDIINSTKKFIRNIKKKVFLLNI